MEKPMSLAVLKWISTYSLYIKLRKIKSPKIKAEKELNLILICILVKIYN